MTRPTFLMVTPPYHCGVAEVAGRWLPLNLLYVAEAARRGGVEPALYDAMSLFVGWDEIRKTLRERRPDYVASLLDAAREKKVAEKAAEETLAVAGS